jgi:GR25 family glycosyltransferase involved in LPS biosynthesis
VGETRGYGMTIDKILLINLDKRKDRLDLFCDQLKNSMLINNKYQRYSAIDGHLIDNHTMSSLVTKDAYLEIMSDKKTTGLYLSRGAVGLALTYKQIFESCKEVTLLLEDDIIVCKNFDSQIQKTLKDVPEDWDIIYLGWYQSSSLRINILTENVGSITGQINGTQGWIINPLSAKKLLRLFPLRYQIDTEIYQNKNLNKYCTVEPIILRSNSHSDIQSY